MTHEQALNRANELWPETDEHGQLYRTAYMQCWEDMQGDKPDVEQLAEQILFKRIEVFPSEGVMTDKAIRRNVIKAMIEFSQAASIHRV